MRLRPFRQVDVFGEAPVGGNPVAVVLDGEGLDDAAQRAFASWTNLSETTFVLPPTDPAADYRVRIWTPGGELPFAGHPTLGTAHAWLEAGGSPRGSAVVQECAVGLVAVRRGERLAFAAPPCRVEPVADEVVAAVVAAAGLAPDDVVDARLLVNGPEWTTLLLRDAEAVLRATPPAVDGVPGVGLVGPHGPGADAAVEVRGFALEVGIAEDPVTGSLNAGIAQWLVPAGVLPEAYVAAQGTALGRTGRVRVTVDGAGTWVGGATTTVLAGTASL